MKKLGYFLARNTTNILALYFIGWAVWAGCNWESVTLVQKLLMGLFLLLVLHEYEEAYKERFWAVMGKVLGVTLDDLKVPGLVHVPADSFIAVWFTLALVFPDKLFVVFPVFILCFFEMFVHNMGIVMFQLKGVSPGWYTAMLQGIYSIVAIVLINRNVEYDGILWLWAFLLFVGSFLILEVTTWKTTGKPIPQILANARTFAKKRFGKQ